MQQKLLPPKNFYQLYSDFFEASSATLVNQLFNLSNISSMDSILEVGTGTGTIFPTLIQQKRKNSKYTAIDISSQFLIAATQRLKYLETQNDILTNEGLPEFQIPEEKLEKYEYSNTKFNIDLKLMNAEKLDFQNDSIDGYFASLALHHSDWDKSLSEAFRVLKQGGRICLVEFGPEAFLQFKDKNPQVEKLLEQMYGQTFIDFRESQKKSEHCHGHSHGHNTKHGHKYQNQKKETHQHENDSNVQDVNKNSKDEVKSHAEFGKPITVHNFFGKDEIQQKLIEHGFKNVLTYQTYQPIYQNKERCIEQYLNNDCETLKSELTQEEQQIIKNKIYQILLSNNQNPTQLKGFDAHVIIGYK